VVPVCADDRRGRAPIAARPGAGDAHTGGRRAPIQRPEPSCASRLAVAPRPATAARPA